MNDQDILQLYEEFHTPKHVRRHCQAVAEFALELGEKITASGEDINLTLLRQAGLLHDFVRVVDFRTFTPETFPDEVTEEDIIVWKKLRETYRGLHHADAGAQILEERGHTALAELVRKHATLQIFQGLHSWTEKILYYADKRAKHDQIVSLRDRLDDGRLRNAPETADTKEAELLDQKIFALEEEIMKKIGTSS